MNAIFDFCHRNNHQITERFDDLAIIDFPEGKTTKSLQSCGELDGESVLNLGIIL